MKKTLLTGMLAIATIFSLSGQNESETTQQAFEIKVITSV